MRDVARDFAATERLDVFGLAVKAAEVKREAPRGKYLELFKIAQGWAQISTSETGEWHLYAF